MSWKTHLRSLLLSDELCSGFVLILFITLFLAGCAPHKKSLFEAERVPLFYDDSDKETLQRSLKRHQHYLDKFPENDVITVGDNTFHVALLSESLKTFGEIIDLEPSPLELDRIVRENFTVFQAGGRSSSTSYDMLVTGYFEPTLQGSLTKEPPFVFPIYSPPDDLIVHNSQDGTKKTGRLDKGGVFQPYWTRGEIDSTSVITGHEIAFLKDRFDAFLLHVQGSGKLLLQDGSVKSIHYAANNGHPYSSIGKLLVDEKKMVLEDVDIPAIRRYLRDNPEDESRILHHNRRFIFFRLGDGEPSRGSIGEPLTPGRSIAIDSKNLPMGMIGYLVSQKPEIDNYGRITGWTPLQRFVLPQDSGSAIKGAGRVDLFLGNGKYAEIAAGAMKEKGYLYFLVKNDFESSGRYRD